MDMIVPSNMTNHIFPPKKRWSYKLKTAGIRTQVLTEDINSFIVHVSDSQLCCASS